MKPLFRAVVVIVIAILVRDWIEDDGCKGTGHPALCSIARTYGDEQLV